MHAGNEAKLLLLLFFFLSVSACSAPSGSQQQSNEPTKTISQVGQFSSVSESTFLQNQIQPIAQSLNSVSGYTLTSQDLTSLRSDGLASEDELADLSSFVNQ